MKKPASVWLLGAVCGLGVGVGEIKWSKLLAQVLLALFCLFGWRHFGSQLTNSAVVVWLEVELAKR